jgi:microcystin-dependent protein
MHYWGTVAPTGWLLVDGGPIDPSYTILRAKFGTNMPDWRSLFVLNAGAVYSLGTGGGAYSFALTAANLPNALQIISSVGLVNAGNARPNPFMATSTQEPAFALTSSAFRGSSQPLSMMPPYVALTLICKIG